MNCAVNEAGHLLNAYGQCQWCHMDKDALRIQALEADRDELREHYDITLKTARRVTRDLRHAIDNVPATNQHREMMRERYQHFAAIFDDIRDYRLRIHTEMANLERENEMLKRNSVAADVREACAVAIENGSFLSPESPQAQWAKEAAAMLRRLK